MPASVPPPDVPLSFLGASGLALVVLGVVLALTASHIVSAPSDDVPIAVTHVAMLGFLTTGVLGALHQFSTVVGMRPLRSIAWARVTFYVVVAGVWLLPVSFASHDNPLVAGAGALLTIGFCLAAWNLSGPLSSRRKDPSLTGLRWSVAGLLTTAGFGVTYAFDRNGTWFNLSPNVDLAHAHIGLLAWLGLAYVAVAEKLWPMFLLAHRPGRSPGVLAVRLVPAGVVVVVAGLLTDERYVALAGGVIVGAGLGCHLASFAGLVRHRRRPLELLHAFVIASAVFLVAAAGLAAAAGFAPVSTTVRSGLASAEVAALASWLGLALLGHVHKVVPFVVWGVFRSREIRTGPGGRPLLFADLWRKDVGRGDVRHGNLRLFRHGRRTRERTRPARRRRRGVSRNDGRARPRQPHAHPASPASPGAPGATHSVRRRRDGAGVADDQDRSSTSRSSFPRHRAPHDLGPTVALYGRGRAVQGRRSR